MSVAWLGRGRRGLPSLAAATSTRWGRSGAIVGGLSGALLGLVLWAPASWVAHRVADASGTRVLLAQADGTVWNGSAALVLTGGPGSSDAAALPGRLQWTLRPAWSGLVLRLRQSCCLSGELALRLTPGWGGVTLRWQDAPVAVAVSTSVSTSASTPIGQWPLAVLAGLGTPWNTLQLDGTLRLAGNGAQLQWVQGRATLQGALQLELEQVRSRMSSLPALGSYRLSLRGHDPAQPQLDGNPLLLDTLNGALRLTGSGQWTGARLRFRGEASAAPGQEAALSNLLNIIGRRQGALSIISIG